MPKFDPGPFLPLPERVTVLPQHGESWTAKAPNWWAGATIASPTSAVAVPAQRTVHNILCLAGDVDRLNQYFVSETETARQWVRTVLSLDASTPVLLDASGTSAILLASRIIAHVAFARGASELLTITTDEGGSLVPATLKGRDPNELEKVMFQPVTGLFYEPSPVLPHPPGLALSLATINLAQSDNAAVLAEMERLMEESRGKSVCIMLPYVSKTGRILPVREVGALVSRQRNRGADVYLIVDDVQGIGRQDAEAVTEPLTFCDAYLFGASKALGGLLIASAVALKEELMEGFAAIVTERAGQLPAACVPWLCHFQLSQEWQERLPAACFKRGAISLPEVTSMWVALYRHYLAGRGETYSERRRFQLEMVRRLRQKVVTALATIPGVTVMESTAERPLVPSIVSFRVEADAAGQRVTPMGLKKALQEGSPIVTPTAPIGRWLRLEIPEYRAMPSVDVLVAKIKEILGFK